MTERSHLWKIKIKDKVSVYVATDEAEHEAAFTVAVISLFGDQASFEGLEPEHPLEKLEYLGEVIT